MKKRQHHRRAQSAPSSPAGSVHSAPNKLSLEFEPFEPRILLSAKWVGTADADTFDGSTSADEAPPEDPAADPQVVTGDDSDPTGEALVAEDNTDVNGTDETEPAPVNAMTNEKSPSFPTSEVEGEPSISAEASLSSEESVSKSLDPAASVSFQDALAAGSDVGTESSVAELGSPPPFDTESLNSDPAHSLSGAEALHDGFTTKSSATATPNASGSSPLEKTAAVASDTVDSSQPASLSHGDIGWSSGEDHQVLDPTEHLADAAEAVDDPLLSTEPVDPIGSVDADLLNPEQEHEVYVHYRLEGEIALPAYSPENGVAEEGPEVLQSAGTLEEVFEPIGDTASDDAPEADIASAATVESAAPETPSPAGRALADHARHGEDAAAPRLKPGQPDELQSEETSTVAKTDSHEEAQYLAASAAGSIAEGGGFFARLWGAVRGLAGSVRHVDERQAARSGRN